MHDDREGALGPYLRALAAHRLALALAVLASLAGAAAWLTLRTPDYRAEAEILVTPLPEANETFIGIPFLVQSGDPTRTVQTAATLVSSEAVADHTAATLGGGITGTVVGESVAVKPKGESNVLSVEATAEAPALARDMANVFARTALDLRSEQLREQIDRTLERLESNLRATQASGRPEALAELSSRIAALENVRDGNDPTLSISELATLPRRPAGAPPWLVVALAAMAGVMLGTALALLLDVAERRVRDEDDLLSIYPLPVLARVPLLSRRRLRHSSTAMPPEVREAFRTLQAQIEVRGASRRSILVTSASRDEGKTTCATNLALSLVAAGHDVLLVDFDLRKPDVAGRLGVDPSARTLARMLDPEARLRDIVVPAPALPLLRVVAAAAAGGDVALLEALTRTMPRILDEAAALAEYVIVDSAPLGEVSDALKLADRVDDILLVARPGHTNRVNLEQARDLLEGAGLTPTGLVVMGERPGGSTAYYGYGQVPERQRGPLARALAR